MYICMYVCIYIYIYVYLYIYMSHYFTTSCEYQIVIFERSNYLAIKCTPRGFTQIYIIMSS